MRIILQMPGKSKFQRSWRIGLIAASFLGLTAILQNTVDAQTNDPKLQQKAEAQIEGTEVVIRIAAVKDNVVSAEEYTKPDAGNKFVSIQIVMDNSKGLEDWEAKPDNFKLKDTEGNIYETESRILGSTKVTQPTLKAGMVDSGDLVRGWITFQVGSSVSLKSLKLRYEDSPFLSESPLKSGWIALATIIK
jgi:Domain of unknown function (DUF4352)